MGLFDVITKSINQLRESEDHYRSISKLDDANRNLRLKKFWRVAVLIG